MKHIQSIDRLKENFRTFTVYLFDILTRYHNLLKLISYSIF